MARLYLIRHGEAAAGWEAARDPGLSPKGRAQARRTCERIAELAEPSPILSSPLRRCRETARPLAELWKRPCIPAPEFSEIPHPPGLGLEGRGTWLKKVMPMRWSVFLADPALSNGADFRNWRQRLIAKAAGFESGQVIFSHFVAINTLIGAASGDDRIISRRPAHASLWVFETNGALRLEEAGDELQGAPPL